MLPGLDDGAEDVEEALEICRAAAADGITVLAGTPHVRRDHQTTADAMEAALELLRAAADSIVRLLPGGELDLDELDRPREELARFGLGGNPAYLLVETPYVGWPRDFAERLFRLRSAGFTPVLAHPERNPEVQGRPALLEPLVAGGALVQLTAAAVDGRIGPRSQACARTLIDRSLAHLIASDAHAPSVRAIGMAAAAHSVGGELAGWLTVGVPGAIVDGKPLPPRPAAEAGRKRRLVGR